MFLGHGPRSRRSRLVGLRLVRSRCLPARFEHLPQELLLVRFQVFEHRVDMVWIGRKQLLHLATFLGTVSPFALPPHTPALVTTHNSQNTTITAPNTNNLNNYT